jgi:PKD repeat protein
LPDQIYSGSVTVATASTTDPNRVLNYTFSWGDNSIANSVTVNSASHVYASPGSYNLQVTLLDNQNYISSSTLPITVVAPPNLSPAVPSLSIPATITVGTAVTVSAASTDPKNLALTYEFFWGDDSAPDFAPSNTGTHTYTTPGAYIIRVTVTNTAGYSSSQIGYANVTAAGN